MTGSFAGIIKDGGDALLWALIRIGLEECVSEDLAELCESRGFIVRLPRNWVFKCSRTAEPRSMPAPLIVLREASGLRSRRRSRARPDHLRVTSTKACAPGIVNGPSSGAWRSPHHSSHSEGVSWPGTYLEQRKTPTVLFNHLDPGPSDRHHGKRLPALASLFLRACSSFWSRDPTQGGFGRLSFCSRGSRSCADARKWTTRFMVGKAAPVD